MKKKSTIFALIAVVCVALALYFMYKETRATYDVTVDEDEQILDEEEEVPETGSETAKTETHGKTETDNATGSDETK